jgi:hypothetical protein
MALPCIPTEQPSMAPPPLLLAPPPPLAWYMPTSLLQPLPPAPPPSNATRAFMNDLLVKELALICKLKGQQTH